MKPGRRHIEIMDTTLRDGEQTSGISFSASEKLTIAQILLTEVNVDRIEIASARVSDGEFEAVKKITTWAEENGYLGQVEVLTFVDGDRSIKWMLNSGARVMNLLTKGSMNHLTHQLKKTPEEHFSDVAKVLSLAQANDLACNVYLEDWSNGMRCSPEYVYRFLDFLKDQPVKRILLPDTLGVLIPSETRQYLTQIIRRYPGIHFDFHGQSFTFDQGIHRNIIRFMAAKGEDAAKKRLSS